MSIFGDLKNDGLEQTEDRLGGFALKPTDAYKAKIKWAYAGKSDGGARNVTLVLNIDGSEYTETVYVTNKKGENWFLNKDDNTKKVPLPGFTTINDICVVCTEKELHQQDTEEKVVKVYDYDEKKELPKTVQMLTDLVGQEFYAGIVQQTVNKNVKNDSTGQYEPSAETRDENTIEKVFHFPTKLTVPEAREGLEAGVFMDKWVDKNKGVVRDKRKDKSGGSAPGTGSTGKAGAAPQGNAGTGERKTSSLFNKKPQ